MEATSFPVRMSSLSNHRNPAPTTEARDGRCVLPDPSSGQPSSGVPGFAEAILDSESVYFV